MRGRPKKPKDEIRDNVLRIRLTEDERATLDKAAKRQGEETSTWARTILVALAQRAPSKK